MERAILELCCDHDSGLGTAAPDFGFVSGRITVDERFDLPRGVTAAQRFVEAHPGLDVWASLVCTPWCSWNRINAARLGKAFRARLAYRRRRSLRMVHSTEAVMTSALRTGGRGHFEWPRGCDGWRSRAVCRMIQRLGMAFADFDGCCFEVLASPGVLALKPWRVASTSRALVTALSAQRCAGDHEHGQLSGAYALQSGHYTVSLCRFVLGVLS